MTFDIAVPSIKLLIEYQGQHHYPQFYGVKIFNMLHREERDKEKSDTCKKYGFHCTEMCLCIDCLNNDEEEEMEEP